MNRRLIWAAAMAIAAGSAGSVWANVDKSAKPTVAADANRPGANEVSLDAVVEAVRQATLSAQVPGAIVSLNVKAGDRVRAGQELLSTPGGTVGLGQHQWNGVACVVQRRERNGSEFRRAGKNDPHPQRAATVTRSFFSSRSSLTSLVLMRLRLSGERYSTKTLPIR